MIYDLSEEKSREAFKLRCNALYKNGKIVELRQVQKKRSLPQNATFHMWVKVIADELGYTSYDDCKTDIKRHLLGMKEYVNHITGEVGKKDHSTSSMTKEQMSSFLERVKMWSEAEMGIILPDPEEYGIDDIK